MNITNQQTSEFTTTLSPHMPNGTHFHKIDLLPQIV